MEFGFIGVGAAFEIGAAAGGPAKPVRRNTAWVAMRDSGTPALRAACNATCAWSRWPSTANAAALKMATSPS